MDITSNSPHFGINSRPYENLIFHKNQWVCHQRTATPNQNDLQVLILPTSQLPENWKPAILRLCSTLQQSTPKKGYLSITLRPDYLLLEMYAEPFQLQHLGRFVPRRWGLTLPYGNQLPFTLQRTGLRPATFDPRTWKTQSPAIKAHRSKQIVLHTLQHHQAQRQKATDLQLTLQALAPTITWNPPLPPIGLGLSHVLTLLNKELPSQPLITLQRHPTTNQVHAQLHKDPYVNFDDPLQFQNLHTVCASISYGC